jgi:gliding motility-associated-like protein
VTVFNIAGCSDSAFINIKVFATGPTVFVPTAFTPNNDGKNDVLRPVAVGMQRIEYFNVYNRWGQLVFSTSFNGAGWDGRISGQSQATNVYVWMVKAIDFNGASYFQKGMVTLIQ